MIESRGKMCLVATIYLAYEQQTYFRSSHTFAVRRLLSVYSTIVVESLLGTRWSVIRDLTIQRRDGNEHVA